MADDKAPEKVHEILIIKRARSHDEQGHGGAWKIAFADFMTAMMALFLVLWLISATNEKTKASLARYFNPVKLVEMTVQKRGLNDPIERSAEDATDNALAPTQHGASAKNEEAKGSPTGKGLKAEKGSSAFEATHSEASLFRDPYAVLAEIAATGPAPKSSEVDHPNVGAAPNFRDPFQAGAPEMPQQTPPGGTNGPDDLGAAMETPAMPAAAASTSPDALPAPGSGPGQGDASATASAAAPAPADAAAMAESSSASSTPSSDTDKAAAKSDVPPDLAARPEDKPAPHAADHAAVPPSDSAATAPMTQKDVAQKDMAKPALPQDVAPATTPKDASPQAKIDAAVKPPPQPAMADSKAAQPKPPQPEALQATRLQSEIQSMLGQTDVAPTIQVKPVPQGVMISLTDGFNYAMFAIGSAEPQPRTIQIMAKIAQILKKEQGTITITGHTDGRRFKVRNYDNWRLSEARAEMALYMLVRGGLDEKRVVKIEGAADHDLKDTKDPFAAENRRIEILLQKSAL